MLNSCLTVTPGQPSSHANQGWEKFTAAVLSVVDQYGGASIKDADGQAAGVGRGVVFIGASPALIVQSQLLMYRVAWGKQAQQCIDGIKPKLSEVCSPGTRAESRSVAPNDFV